jgi:hypothetical protein
MQYCLSLVQLEHKSTNIYTVQCTVRLRFFIYCICDESQNKKTSSRKEGLVFLGTNWPVSCSKLFSAKPRFVLSILVLVSPSLYESFPFGLWIRGNSSGLLTHILPGPSPPPYPNVCLPYSSLLYNMWTGYQRHILRDRWPISTTCPTCWATGTNDLK